MYSFYWWGRISTSQFTAQMYFLTIFLFIYLFCSILDMRAHVHLWSPKGKKEFESSGMEDFQTILPFMTDHIISSLITINGNNHQIMGPT